MLHQKEQRFTKQSYSVDNSIYSWKPGPGILLIILIIVAFIAELLIMFFLSFFPSLSKVSILFIDSTTLVILLTPSLYIFLYTPLSKSIQGVIDSEKEFQTLIKTTTAGFFIADVNSNGKFLVVNDAYCIMTGYSREDLLQMKISDVSVFELPEATKKHIENIVQKGHDRFITHYKTKSGDLIHLEVFVTYLSSKNGKLYVFLHDISNREKYKETLILQNKKLFEIAFLQSHQVREPVSNILGLISIINFDNTNDPNNLEVIKNLKKMTIKFDKIIHKIVLKTNEIEEVQKKLASDSQT